MAVLCGTIWAWGLYLGRVWERKNSFLYCFSDLPSLWGLLVWTHLFQGKYTYITVMSDSLWPHGCSPPGSSIQGISQAEILEWVAISSSRGSSWPRDQTWVSCFAGRFLTMSHLELPYICLDWSNSITFTNFLSDFILISYLYTVLSNDSKCPREKWDPSMCPTFAL